MHICKKKPKNGGKYLWIWIAVDRNNNKICDFEIGDRSFATWLRLALRLEKAYNIKHLCTDSYESYSKYKISEFHHTTKSETCLVEAKNSSL